jgi:hypothetical protein
MLDILLTAAAITGGYFLIAAIVFAILQTRVALILRGNVDVNKRRDRANLWIALLWPLSGFLALVFTVVGHYLEATEFSRKYHNGQYDYH